MKFLSQINVNTEYALPIVDGANGQVLTTDGSGAVYWGSVSIGALNLDGLQDVVITTPTSGQILRYGIPVGSGDQNPVWYNWTPNFVTTANAVTITGTQTITGSKTFTAATTMSIASGNDVALTITKGGSHEALYINKTSGSGNAVTIVGTLEATTIVKTGGTSSQFLKADGSVDTNTYLTSYTETQTLDAVTDLGNTTTNAITVGGLTSTSVTTPLIESSGLLIIDADTSGGLQPDQGDPAVPVLSFDWQGSTQGYIDTDGKITFNGFKTPSGTSSQFLKANGTVDSNVYITSAALSGYATQTWVNSNFYNQGQIDDFFYGNEPILGYNKTNWDTAYDWGNHDEAGYLTSFTETDPTVPDHVKAITETQISDWDRAYNWGNHADYGYAPIASPSFTGTPSAPTAAAGTNTTQIATTAFVRTEITNLVDAAPATLDTLNELAAALGDDPNFATTVADSIATKVPQTRTLTINGTALDLSADRSWTIDSADGYVSNVRLVETTLTFEGEGNAFAGGVDLSTLPFAPQGSYLTAESDTLATVTGRGASTSSDVAFGADSGGDRGIQIKYGSDVNDYGRIRFYQNNSNHTTIHSFSANWQSGTIFTASSGGLNFAAQNGVTFGDWNDPYVVLQKNGISYFKYNVGIGTTAPKQKLIVEGTLATKPSGVDGYYSYLRSNWAENNAFELGISEDGASNFHKLITSSNYYFGSTLQFWTSDTEKMRITSGGNVGIGTTNPAANLDVSATQPLFRLTNTEDKSWTSGQNIGKIEFFTKDSSNPNGTKVASFIQVLTDISSSVPAGALAFGTSAGGGASAAATEVMRITGHTGGNVGIGTTNPQHGLHISKNQNQVAAFQSPNPNTWIDLISTAGTWSMGATASNTWAIYQRGAVNALEFEVSESAAFISGEKVATQDWVTSQGYLTSETDSQTIDWNQGEKTLTISNGNTVTLEGLAAEDFVTSQGYITGYTETDPVYTSERDSLLLNKTIQPTLLFSTLEDYNKPSGYSTMIQPSSYQNPLPSHGYYHIIARRDTGGGYGALLQSYNTHELYHGNTTQNTSDISWYKIWTSGDFTSTNVTNWNTAYGWGNNYISDVRLSESNLEFTGEGSAFTGTIDLSGLPFQPAGSYLTAEADTLATVTARGSSTTSGITVSGDITVSGVSTGIYFTGGNNRIYFAGARAIEGNGTNLQIGEGHSQTQIQSSTTRVDGILTTAGTSINDSNGARIFGLKSESGKYFTQNAFGQDGGYTWPSTTYVTGNDNSPVGNVTFRGSGAYQGHVGPEYVPIDATKTYKVSVWIRAVSGSPFCYLSHRQYYWDYSNGNPTNGGWGNPYWWSGTPSSSWTEYSMTIGPAGSGADHTHMAGVKFIQHGWLHNYTADGSATAEFQGWKIEELDNTLANNVTVMGNAVVHAGNIGSQSVSYATSSGNSVSTDQTNFSELFIEDAPVATKEYVTSQGYITGSYLPLTGGTLSGNLTFSTQGSKITFGDSTSTNPCMIGEGLVGTEGTDSDFLTIYARSSLRIYSTVTTERARFDINGLTVNGTITEQSSIRYKKDVVGIEFISDRVELLKPVRYKKIENDAEEIGLIAEDVAELFPEVVKYDNEGRPDGVNYSRLSVILLKAVQELTERVNKLENK